VGGYLVLSMHLDSILHEIIMAELCMWPCYVCMDLVPHPYLLPNYTAWWFLCKGGITPC